jgi:hypothetical protein
MMRERRLLPHRFSLPVASPTARTHFVPSLLAPPSCLLPSNETWSQPGSHALPNARLSGACIPSLSLCIRSPSFPPLKLDWEHYNTEYKFCAGADDFSATWLPLDGVPLNSRSNATCSCTQQWALGGLPRFSLHFENVSVYEKFCPNDICSLDSALAAGIIFWRAFWPYLSEINARKGCLFGWVLD